MNMRRFLTIMLFCAVMAVSYVDAMAQMHWREGSARIENAQSLNDPNVSDGVEIFGVDGAIVVRTNHRVQVRVFTILGQLVSQTVLNAGTSELKINSRGIYIVKIGNITQKVAL